MITWDMTHTPIVKDKRWTMPGHSGGQLTRRLARLTRTTKASPSVKQKKAVMNCEAIHTEPDGSSHCGNACIETAIKGADWRNYKRSLLQRSMLRTLMKDARGGLIR